MDFGLTIGLLRIESGFKCSAAGAIWGEFEDGGRLFTLNRDSVVDNSASFRSMASESASVAESMGNGKGSGRICVFSASDTTVSAVLVSIGN